MPQCALSLDMVCLEHQDGMLPSKGVFGIKVAERKVRKYGGKELVAVPKVIGLCSRGSLLFHL